MPFPEDDSSLVENCYAAGSSTSPHTLSPFGYNGNIKSCFWDDEKLSIDSIGKGIGLPTSEMMKQSTFEQAGWDFENVWYIEEGMSYPKLRAFLHPDPVGEEGIASGIGIEVYPNPLSYSATVKYELAHPGNIRLTLRDLFGREALELESRYARKGSHVYELNTDALSTGIYYIALEQAGHVAMKKIQVLK